MDKSRPGHEDRCSNPSCECHSNPALLHEIVICAAVRAKDGTVIRGHRHVHALRALQDIPGYERARPHGPDQGFITSHNRYVTRTEAYELQKAAGIKSADEMHPYQGGECYSEDLY